MDSVLIEVAIGLLLIYIGMAFLLMKVQEGVFGGWGRARVSNLHDMVLEAVGQDATLKQKVLDNRLLFALHQGEHPARKGGTFSRATGPSSIPADLFARALLMELNPSGQLPSTERLTPLAFLDKLISSERADSSRARYLSGLRGLVPSAATGWPEFEMALATWFADIGDRADGWYRRSSGTAGFVLALLLCALLNVDAGHIINTLGSDADLRQGFGRLADVVLQQRGQAQATPTASPDPTQEPSVRAIARLVDANAQITEAYRKDKAITRFGHYMTEVTEACPDVKLEPSDVPREGKFVSNSDTWVAILPALLPSLEAALQSLNPNSDPAEELRKGLTCLSHVSAWVRAASTASNSVDTRRVMVEAANALEDSKTALLHVLHGARLQGGLRALFVRDPEAFARCANEPGATVASLRPCVLREQSLMDRLPIGLSPSHLRQQFCSVQERRDSKPPAQAAASSPAYQSNQVNAAVVVVVPPDPAPATAVSTAQDGPWLLSLCRQALVPTPTRLNLPGLNLRFDPFGLVAWLVGVLVSAVFVSLGAPILFDLLGKWVNLRNSGPVRDALQGAAKGGGTLPLPMLAAGTAASATPAGTSASASAAGASSLPAVEGAVGSVEEVLSPREIQALRQRLDVQPAAGGFDAALRAALRPYTGDAPLSWAVYFKLMGRPPAQAGATAAGVASTGAQLRQPFALAASLADNLDTKLGFPRRVPATETRFSDELRALAVLYRYKTGPATPDNPIFAITDDHPDQLNQVDDALLGTMLNASATVYPRHAKPWLDIALGELGQVESNGSSRATSNPRICEYLDAASPGLGDQGDTTAWCGAFVAWVLKHPHATDPATTPPITLTPPVAPSTWASLSTGFAIPAANPAGAANWTRWPRPGAAAASIAGPGGAPEPEEGDVVVVSNGQGGHHVGFVYRVNSATGQFWMLGGNQRAGTRVSLSCWKLSSIV